MRVAAVSTSINGNYTKLKRPAEIQSKAELKEKTHIPTNPEKLAKALGKKVKIRLSAYRLAMRFAYEIQ